MIDIVNSFFKTIVGGNSMILRNMEIDLGVIYILHNTGWVVQT